MECWWTLRGCLEFQCLLSHVLSYFQPCHVNIYDLFLCLHNNPENPASKLSITICKSTSTRIWQDCKMLEYYKLLRFCHAYVITAYHTMFHPFAYELIRSNEIYLLLSVILASVLSSCWHLSVPCTLIST